MNPRDFIATYAKAHPQQSFASAVAPCPCCQQKACTRCDPATRCGYCFHCSSCCTCSGGPQQAELFAGFVPVDEGARGKGKDRDGKGYGT